MLIESKLGHRYWPLAIKTAAYIINRRPHSAIDDEIPFELIYAKEVDFSQLHVFGSKAHVWTPPEKRLNKFSQVAKTMMFVGCSDNPTAFKFLDVAQSKVSEQHTFTVVDGTLFYHDSNETPDDDAEAFKFQEDGQAADSNEQV